MPETIAHPSQDQLSAYNLGRLPADEAAAIESHISKCEPCCDTIISLSSDDTFVGQLKEARQLPTDQTVDHAATASSSDQDVPVELAEHPRYEILGLIGKGGMGDVYKARHRKMERTVALKVVNRGLVRKAEAVDRFHREVKTAAQLSHPNIVTAYDADQADDFHFMVMEYVDGVDLSQTVKDRGALPVAEACDYIRQAAIGLQHAHQRGMVHRDIKPHNLMVTKDGTVKILDFGLASLAPEAIADADTVEARGDLTAAGAIMGTPDFISPEQADDARTADIRSDIYSLGSTLYFLLSGQPPFADGSVMHKLKSHAQAEPESLESLRDDIPPELVGIVTKMTAKDPEERYLTPSEVADALESFLQAWQPNDAASQGQEPSHGRFGSGSDEDKLGTPDGRPEWLPVASKWLLYIAWIPIALLMWEVFFLEGTSVAAGYRALFYMGAAICLATVAGALGAALRFQSEIRQIERGDRRIFRMKADEALIVAGILIGALCALVHYIQTNHGVVRIEVNDPSLQVSLNDQTITMKDKDGKTLTIRPGEQTLIVRKGDADFEFETDRFQIRRGDEVAFKVEMLQGEIVVLKDGERFHSKALSDDIEVRQILDRMEKAYAECKSYRDSGVIKSVFSRNTGSPELTVEHSFTTAFVRPDRFRFEIKNEDNRLLISANGKDVQTWWDVEPGVKKPESLDFALAQANGFIGGDTGRIPAMLMPQELELSGDLDLIDPKQIEDGKLQNVECFRLEYNFRDEQFTLWIDKQSYLVRRIDERIKTDDVRIERTTTYDPIIDRKITDEMLDFDPPSPRAADDRAPPQARISLDQGYTILDGGKEIGSRHLVVTQDDRTLSIVEEYSLALQFDGAPLGIVERGVSAVYSLAGDTPLLMRGTNSTKEQGALVMHGTVEFENGEAEMRWTSYMDGGRKLDRPSKQQATVKLPPGPLVLGSTIQVVGPLLLPEDGERKVVCATFNNKVREGKPLVEYQAGCTLKRTSRPDGEGFTITLFEPDSDKPELTWEYDSQGNCESIQPTSTTVMKPLEAAPHAEEERSEGDAKRKTTAFLVEAAKSGDLAAVEAALKAGVDPDGPAHQLTALHWAVAQRISDGKTIEPSPEIAKRLIEAGANVNARDYLGQTPLEWAAKYASPDIVDMLIKADADVNAESRYGTVLMAGTRVEIAKLLIEAGVDVNAGKYTSALANAAKYGNAELIRLLVEEGAKVNDPKDPPIHWAGKPEAAKALLDAGADVNQRNANGETALHLVKSTWSPNAETVKLLIGAGADVKAQNETGATPLHAAVQMAKPDIVRLLVAAGADVDAKDKQGNTPLSLAHQALSCARGQQQVDSRPYEAAVQVLVDAGAKDDGRTELQQAVAAGDLEQVKKLIAARVDVNATGPQRITAVHIASEKGHAEILAALIEAGAKSDQTDEQRMRPLHLAANADIARMLIAEGAKVNSPAPSPLYMATAGGKPGVVQELVRDEAIVTDSDCAEILNWATLFGAIDVVKVLFDQRDAKRLLSTSDVYSPLHVAASGTFGGMNSPEDVTPERRLDIAKLLVEKGADIDARWGANVNPQSGAAHMIDTTPLMFASRQGDVEMVKFLIDQQADAKAVNASGQTALHFAAQQGHRSVVELLLDTNADVNALTREAKTPLDVTQDAAVKILLIQKAGKTASEILEDSQR